MDDPEPTADMTSRKHADMRREVYIGALSFASALAVLPGGCCLFDASMMIVNGIAVAIYGGMLGVLAKSRRGRASGIACIVLGSLHPIWLLAISFAATSLGFSKSSLPFSTVPTRSSQVLFDNAMLFAVTGAVFALALGLCLLRLRSVMVLLAAATVSPLSLYALEWAHPQLPLGRLWPSSLSFPAAILHAGIATSLWVGLPRISSVATPESSSRSHAMRSTTRMRDDE